jgi:cytochrome P450
MYPPFPELAWRQVTTEHQLGAHMMKKRDNVILSLVEPNRNPLMFENPNEFDPSRWTEDFE